MATKATKSTASAVEIIPPNATNTGTGIVKGRAEAKAFVDQALSLYADSGLVIDRAFLTAMYHTAMTGNPVLLNRLYAGLRPNDQTAVRLYIYRIEVAVGLNRFDGNYLAAFGHKPTKAEMDAAADAGRTIKLKQGEFIVVHGHTSKQAIATAEMVDTHVSGHASQWWPMVLHRDNPETARELQSETSALKSLMTAVARVLKNKNISASNVRYLKGLEGQLEERTTEASLRIGEDFFNTPTPEQAKPVN